MRFSLRFLLFVVPCILVAAYFVIWNVQGYFDSKRDDTFLPYWKGTQYELDDFSEFFSKRNLTPNDLSICNLNIWFSGKLSPIEHTAILLKEFDNSKVDSWGQTYVAVGLDENILPTQNSAKAKTIGIYSNGKDGFSKSHGCDPDDIASWRMEEFLASYEKEKESNYWRGRKISALIILLTGVFGVLLLWVIGVVGYRMTFKKA